MGVVTTRTGPSKLAGLIFALVLFMFGITGLAFIMFDTNATRQAEANAKVRLAEIAADLEVAKMEREDRRATQLVDTYIKGQESGRGIGTELFVLASVMLLTGTVVVFAVNRALVRKSEASKW